MKKPKLLPRRELNPKEALAKEAQAKEVLVAKDIQAKEAPAKEVPAKEVLVLVAKDIQAKEVGVAHSEDANSSAPANDLSSDVAIIDARFVFFVRTNQKK